MKPRDASCNVNNKLSSETRVCREKKVCIQIMTPISSNIDYIFDHIGHPRVGSYISYPWGCFPPCNTTLGIPTFELTIEVGKCTNPGHNIRGLGRLQNICCSDNGGYIPSHYANIPKKNRQHLMNIYIYIIYDIYDIYIYTYMICTQRQGHQ